MRLLCPRDRRPSCRCIQSRLGGVSSGPQAWGAAALRPQCLSWVLWLLAGTRTLQPGSNGQADGVRAPSSGRRAGGGPRGACPGPQVVCASSVPAPGGPVVPVVTVTAEATPALHTPPVRPVSPPRARSRGASADTAPDAVSSRNCRAEWDLGYDSGAGVGSRPPGQREATARVLLVSTAASAARRETAAVGWRGRGVPAVAERGPQPASGAAFGAETAFSDDAGHVLLQTQRGTVAAGGSRPGPCRGRRLHGRAPR